MIQRLTQALRLYLRLIGAQLRSQLQYRVSFAMSLFGTGLTSTVEYLSLALVFGRFESLKGWTLGEVALLYGTAEFAFGIMDMLFSGFDPQTFGLNVRKGSFDQLLLRPVNITLQVLGSRFLLRRVGKIVVGALILATGLQARPIAWDPLRVSLLVTMIVSQILFFGGLFIIGATITFWTIESIEVVNIFTYGGTYMISHPMHIYPHWLRRFFTYIVPAAFLGYYPALVILNKPDPFGLPAFAPFLAPLAGLGVLAAALAFWRFGIRQYQSTGT